MASSLEERERAFENKFAHDQELKFKAEARRNRLVAIWAAGFSGGAALGPIFGGWLVEHFWWGAILLVAVPIILPLLALGPALFALMLALGGYLSSEGRDISQPDSALTAIALGFSLVPAALTILSLWWLRQYTLDPAEVAAATSGPGHGLGHGGTDG